MEGGSPIVDQVNPDEAYKLLESLPQTALIDVRTRAEWSYVGMPDLSALGQPVWPVELVGFPNMAGNPNFLSELAGRMGDCAPERLFFICRSGARSMAAAKLTAEALSRQGIAAHCTNVAEGFEGDLDPTGHRGTVNGWKVRGLPWRQS